MCLTRGVPGVGGVWLVLCVSYSIQSRPGTDRTREQARPRYGSLHSPSSTARREMRGVGADLRSGGLHCKKMQNRDVGPTPLPVSVFGRAKKSAEGAP